MRLIISTSLLIPAYCIADEISNGTIDIPRSGKEVVSQPSVEAASLAKHLDHPFNYSTGTATINIPLYELNAGEISLPISLSYNTRGIKVEDKPGTVGLGWELMCGGFVSRSVYGMPENEDGIPLDFRDDDEIGTQYLIDLYSNQIDAQYDRYSYRACAHSGSFIIEPYGVIRQLPAADMRIRKDATGFNISSPDGTEYIFDIPERLEYSYTPITINNTDVRSSYSCTNMWRLSRIVSPSRLDTIHISYTAIPQKTESTTSETASVSWSKHNGEISAVSWSHRNQSGLISSFNHRYTNRHRISSIRGRTGHIDFQYASPTSERCTGFKAYNSEGNILRDISLTSGNRLTAYRITDSSGNVLDGADFTYTLGTIIKKKDFFGYNNYGITSAAALTQPAFGAEERTFDSVLRRDMSVNWERMSNSSSIKSDILRTITTIAGTQTTYEYEPSICDIFLYAPPVTIGLRVKREKIVDSVTGNIRQRDFKYEDPATTIDFDCLVPGDFISVSGTTDQTSAQAIPTYYSTGSTLSASCRVPGHAPESASIYYGKVTEKLSGSGLTSPIITTYEYDTSRLMTQIVACGRQIPQSGGVNYRIAGTRATTDPVFSTDSITCYDDILSPHPVRGYFPDFFGDRCPLTKKTEWCISSGDTIPWKTTEYHYSYIDNRDIALGRFCEPLIRSTGGLSTEHTNPVTRFDFYGVDDFNYFTIHGSTGRVVTDSIIETELGDNGISRRIRTVYSYTNHRNREPGANDTIIGPWPRYRLGLDHSICMLNGIIVRCGSEKFEKSILYSASSNDSVFIPLDSIWRINVPVAVQYSPKAGQFITESIEYEQFNDIYDVRPRKTSIIKNPTDTIDVTAIIGYDSYGNPLGAIRNHGTPCYYSWDNYGQSLSSISMSGLSTNYTHIPGIGCTSETTPSGLVKNYGYIGARLGSIGLNGDILNRIEYSVYREDGENSITKSLVSDNGAITPLSKTLCDGFGNEIITANFTGDGGIYSSRTTFDALGRKTRCYMPSPGIDAQPASVEFYYGDSAPYTSLSYKHSNDSRPEYTTLAGEDHINHPSHIYYDFNDCYVSTEGETTCRQYTLSAQSASPQITLNGFYPKGVLSIERVIDADGGKTLVFKDYRGRKILDRDLYREVSAPVSQSSSLLPTPYKFNDTYYLYDDFDNLLAVIPPLASDQMHTVGMSWDIDSPFIQDNCHLYKYDSLMRLKEKKSPGAAKVCYWYDKSNNLIFSADGNQQQRGVMLYSIPDSAGRECIVGECLYDSEILASLESRRILARKIGRFGYAPNINLHITSRESTLFYDDYTYCDDSDFATLLNYAGETGSYKQNPKGLVTGGVLQILKPSYYSGSGVDTVPAYKRYINFYDSRDRLVLKISSTTHGLYLKELFSYDYNDNLVSHTITHKLSATSLNGIHYNFEYDRYGKLLKTFASYNNASDTISENVYSDIGRLSSQRLGNSSSPINYTYNINGGLTDIQSPTFSQHLSYDGSHTGNITGNNWINSSDGISRCYEYTYDGLNRLRKANYSETGRTGSSFIGAPDYSSLYEYNKDTAPTSIRRYGLTDAIPNDGTDIYSFGLVDDLDFSYNGVYLSKVSDNADPIYYAGASDFNDGYDSDSEYDYDLNGNMTADHNRGITSIIYNRLNLPAKIEFQDGSYIENFYTSLGDLSSRTVGMSTGRPTIMHGQIVYILRQENHYYENGFEYKKSGLTGQPSLALVRTPVGYIKGNKHFYYIHDYQGNIRQVIDGDDGSVKQQNDYYPYGMLFGESVASSANLSFQPYRFSGKEYISQSSANLYDHSGRYYNPATAIFIEQDPKQEMDFFSSKEAYNASYEMEYQDPTDYTKSDEEAVTDNKAPDND